MGKRFKYRFYIRLLLILICKANKILLFDLNADLDKCKYRNQGIGFDSCSELSFTDGSMEKDLLVFGMIWGYWYKNKDVFILSEGLTQELDDTTLTVKAKYYINFTQPRKQVSYLLIMQK